MLTLEAQIGLSMTQLKYAGCIVLNISAVVKTNVPCLKVFVPKCPSVGQFLVCID